MSHAWISYGLFLDIAINIMKHFRDLLWSMTAVFASEFTAFCIANTFQLALFNISCKIAFLSLTYLSTIYFEVILTQK